MLTGSRRRGSTEGGWERRREGERGSEGGREGRGEYLGVEGGLEGEELPVLVTAHNHVPHQILVRHGGGGGIWREKGREGGREGERDGEREGG